MSRHIIKIANKVTLPADVVTQSIAILAKKRAGKSYTARRLAEQLHYAGQQIVVVDPKGDWWGMRSSADGKQPGIPIVILGGEHGDVPLEVGAGEVVARLVVEERASVLIDLSLLRKGEVSTFMTAFLENLYRLKAREIYRTPVMVIVDEADAIAPQKPYPNEARMLGSIEDIVRRGGQRGIGCTLISQRSAVLNKNVLTQTQLMIAMRTIAPQDLKAMDEWINVHGTREQRATLMSSLPSLQVGDGKGKSSTAWFWSPGWPTADGIFVCADVLPIDTFDSGATPAPGEKRIEPKNLADVDLGVLRKQMAATIERAKADDPKMLRKQIADLTKQLAAAANPKTPTAKEVRVEVPVISAAEIRQLEQAVDRSVKLVEKLEALGAVQGLLGSLVARVQSFARDAKPPSAHEVAMVAGVKTTNGTYRRIDHTEAAKKIFDGSIGRALIPCMNALADGDKIPSGAQLMLLAIARTYPNPTTRAQVAVLTGIRPSGSTFRTYIGMLRRLELVAGGDGALVLTSKGSEKLGNIAPPPSDHASLLAMWREKIPSGAGFILAELASAYPDAMDRDEVGKRLNIEPTGSTMRTYLGLLRRIGVVERGEPLRASAELFP